MIHGWLKLQCPDCCGAVEEAGGSLRCRVCSREFAARDGILYLLPRGIEHRELKEQEKQGWQNLCTRDLEKLKDYYLSLPFAEENAAESSHYREAARQYRLAAQYLDPLAGKKGLDLGGSIGWAAYRFALAGAQMALTDFNDSPEAGLGAARVYLEQGARVERICGDAECLPLADGQFDFVFSCAFLHHLQRPGRAIGHVARILKPGGVFIAVSEGFCPFWLTRRRALARCQRALEFMEEGINEQVFYQREYQRWFSVAGLTLQTVIPRWDEVATGRISRNVRLADPAFAPEIFANRSGRKGLAGAAARLALGSGLWKLFAQPMVFALLRPLLLSGTQKFRILIGKKCGGGKPADA